VLVEEILARVNDYRTGRQCVFALHVHLVFVTKYHRKVFTPAALDDLRTIFVSVCADFESALIEMQGKDDDVHLLVNFPPKALRRLNCGVKRRDRSTRQSTCCADFQTDPYHEIANYLKALRI